VTSTVQTPPDATASPSGPTPRPRRGRRWRLALAALVIVPSFIGQIWGTDDAWPFAPFRMFASPTRRTTTILHPVFIGVTADGVRHHLYSDDFGVRRAEVEPNLGRHHRLPPALLADLATSYNARHPDRRLVALELHSIGQKLVDGRPGAKVDVHVQTWAAP
jgi:hypothetical protein